MRYITEINAFNNMIPIWRLSSGQIAMWYGLMAVANRTGWKPEFDVANSTLRIMTGLSRNGVRNARDRLKDLGLIDYTPRGTLSTLYRMHSLAQYVQASVQDTDHVTAQSSAQGTAQVSDPNPDKTRRDKTGRDNKEGAKAPQKVAIADFVHMTSEEWDKLVAAYGEPAARRMVEILSNYKGSKGKQYKSDYRAILSWVATRYQEEQEHKVRSAQIAGRNAADKRYDDPNDFFEGGYQL